MKRYAAFAATLAAGAASPAFAAPALLAPQTPLVLAGAAILEAIQRDWPSERVRVADRGLREGLLMNMMREDGVWNRKAVR